MEKSGKGNASMSKVVRFLLVIMVLVGYIAVSRLSAIGDRAGAAQVALRDGDYSGSQR